MLRLVKNLRCLLHTPRFSFAKQKQPKPPSTLKQPKVDPQIQMLQKDTQDDQNAPIKQVTIQDKYLDKTSALYDKYIKVRQKPIICHDGLLLAYQFVIQRLPIFYPYNNNTFNAFRNRYQYAKKTGFYVELPKDLRIQNGDYPFRDYDQNNQENTITHQITLSQTQKITYRQHSKLWKYTDPNITDPHSIQTYSSDNVFFTVKQNGKWKFPTKLLNQKDNHSNIFTNMTFNLFQQTKFPMVHFPSKKPMGIRKARLDGQQKQARILTYRGVLVYGIPKITADCYEDYAWLPKPLLGKYFEEKYLGQAAWAAVHGDA